MKLLRETLSVSLPVAVRQLQPIRLSCTAALLLSRSLARNRLRPRREQQSHCGVRTGSGDSSEVRGYSTKSVQLGLFPRLAGQPCGVEPHAMPATQDEAVVGRRRASRKFVFPASGRGTLINASALPSLKIQPPQFRTPNNVTYYVSQSLSPR